MEKCSSYDENTNKCSNGFLRVHPVCWGGSIGCPTCGHIETQPDCMDEDLPPPSNSCEPEMKEYSYHEGSWQHITTSIKEHFGWKELTQAQASDIMRMYLIKGMTLENMIIELEEKT